MNIKVCGMRDAGNIADICALPIHYLGFIFFPRSPRFVGNDFDPTITRQVPARIQKVGVFVDEQPARIIEKTIQFDLQCIQLHGNESPQTCLQVMNHGATIIKAFGINDKFDFSILDTYAGACHYFLFDTKSSAHGGTGQKFDWNILRRYNNQQPIFLSGGISSEDVHTIKTLDWLNIHALDINSRFEISPALKNVDLVGDFVRQF